MNKTELAYLNVVGQAKLIENKEISPVDLIQLYLDRIEKWDGVLHSWITVCAERALDQAKKAEAEIAQGNYRGPLHGIPFGAKDQITTGDVPTTMASIIQPDFGEGMTATAVTRLEEAGAILLGKNNLHEFGKGSSVKFHFGEPKNPWTSSTSLPIHRPAPVSRSRPGWSLPRSAKTPAVPFAGPPGPTALSVFAPPSGASAVTAASCTPGPKIPSRR